MINNLQALLLLSLLGLACCLAPLSVSGNHDQDSAYIVQDESTGLLLYAEALPEPDTRQLWYVSLNLVNSCFILNRHFRYGAVNQLATHQSPIMNPAETS